MRLAIAFVIAAVGFAGAAFAAQPATSATAQNPGQQTPVIQAPATKVAAAAGQAAKNDPNEMICERIVITGSKLSKRRVCRTRAQIEKAADANQKEAERLLNRPQTLQTSGG